MRKDEEIDKHLAQLAEAVSVHRPVVVSEKVDLNLKVDKFLKKRLQLVYGRNLSRMFEEHMLSRLSKDGHLAPAKGLSGDSREGVSPKGFAGGIDRTGMVWDKTLGVWRDKKPEEE